MLQIDHIYEFLYTTLFKDFALGTLPRGVIPHKSQDSDYTLNDIHVFNWSKPTHKIFLWDQEPLDSHLIQIYFHLFDIESSKIPCALITSEHSQLAKNVCQARGFKYMYYFFHGFAALDWYRGFRALNYTKDVEREYQYDYVNFNRLVVNDRSYRCYLVSQLIKYDLLDHGQVSFGLDNEQGDWRDEVNDPNTKLSSHAVNEINQYLPNLSGPLTVDSEVVYGWASADIPRVIEQSFWHVVTETVFYYPKQHLTEKIFKPIAMKQPFMLIAAPGNLAYLKSYGFKTFDTVIDESYDTIEDPDARIDAVIRQLHWYCNLSPGEKTDIIRQLKPIIEYNFQHFYGEFRQIIARELLDNAKILFAELGHDDSHIDYAVIENLLTV